MTSTYFKISCFIYKALQHSIAASFVILGEGIPYSRLKYIECLCKPLKFYFWRSKKSTSKTNVTEKIRNFNWDLFIHIINKLHENRFIFTHSATAGRICHPGSLPRFHVKLAQSKHYIIDFEEGIVHKMDNLLIASFGVSEFKVPCLLLKIDFLTSFDKIKKVY